LGLTDNTRLTSVKSAEKLMSNVRVALHYGRQRKLERQGRKSGGARPLLI